jgi:hypothetical protein
MTYKRKPTAEDVRRFLRYEPDSGKLFWLPRSASDFISGRWSAEASAKRWNTQNAGNEAFTATDARGYKIGAIKCLSLPAHRVCWAAHYGEWPADQVDHINGDRTDNRIANLRLATNRENSINSAKNKNNTTGFTGVSRHRGRFRAQIKVYGRQIFLGYFDCPEAAYKAYCAAKDEHGFSERHGT